MNLGMMGTDCGISGEQIKSTRLLLNQIRPSRVVIPNFNLGDYQLHAVCVQSGSKVIVIQTDNPYFETGIKEFITIKSPNSCMEHLLSLSGVVIFFSGNNSLTKEMSSYLKKLHKQIVHVDKRGGILI